MQLSRHRLIILILLSTFFYSICSNSVFAIDKYVTDILRITLRTGPGNSNKIIKTLHSGEKVEILQETDSGYTLVRLEDNDRTEGWLRTQYLQNEPVARSVVNSATDNAKQLTETVALLSQKVSDLSTTKTQLKNERDNLLINKTDLEKENRRFNKIASRPIELDNDNKKLKKLNVELEHKLQRLTQENQVLKDKDSQGWVIVGAVVLLLGMLIGIIIPKIKWRKKSAWDF